MAGLPGESLRHGLIDIPYPGGKPSLTAPLREETILNLGEFHGRGTSFVVATWLTPQPFKLVVE